MCDDPTEARPAVRRDIRKSGANDRGESLSGFARCGDIRRRVPGPEEAFDLTAETFAAALSSVPRFQPGPEPPQAWLFAIARHKLSEALRSSRIQDEARHALAMQPIHLDDEAIEILEAAASAPAVELLDSLAPEQREAVMAHHVEERGYTEIATELRCSESVIRKRVSRGLAVMRAQLRNGEFS